MTDDQDLMTLARLERMLHGDTWPGVTPDRLDAGTLASVTAVDASLRVLLSRPGLRFCGMALDT